MYKVFLNNLLEPSFSFVLKGGLSSLAAKLLASLAGLVSSLIVARVYGESIVGSLALALMILQLPSVLSLLGTQVSLLKIFNSKSLRNSRSGLKNLLYKLIKFVLFNSMVLIFALFLIKEKVSVYMFEDGSLTALTFCVIICIAFFSLNSLAVSSIRGMQNIRFLIYSMLVQPVSFCLLIFLSLAFEKWDYSPVLLLLVSIILAAIVNTRLAFLAISKKPNEAALTEDSYPIKRILRLSFPMFLTSIVWILMGQIDILMLGNIASLKEVGVYSVVLKLAGVLTIALMSMNNFLAPKLAELYSSNKRVQMLELAKKSSILATTLSLLITLAYLLFGEFVLYQFGAEFTVGYSSLLILTIAQFINTFCGSVGFFMDMTGKQTIFNRIVIVALIINIFANWLLIPKYGINGAAFASLASTVFWNLCASWYIYKTHKAFIGFSPKFILKLTKAG